MIVSFVSFHVAEHRLPAFEAWFEPLAARTRHHTGCLRFDHLVLAGDPCSRTLVEVWSDADAHQAHLAERESVEMATDGSARYGMSDLTVWKWTDAAPPTVSRRPSTSR